MTPNELLSDAFGRVPEAADGAVRGLSREALAWRPMGHGNSIAWLVWHLARIQDAQVADIAGTSQVWTTDGWYERFALPFGPEEHGYGHSDEQVAAVQAEADLLLGYLAAVHAASLDCLRGLSEADLDRVIDRNWDPPVTVGVRLVSVVDDCAQHIGQAAYLRGLIDSGALG